MTIPNISNMKNCSSPLSMFPTNSRKRRITHNINFSAITAIPPICPGKSLLPVYLEEKLTQSYYRKNPEKTKKIVEGEKKVNIVNFVDEEGVNNYLNRMYYEVDIYSNNIFLMTNQFLSPICRWCTYFL